MRKRLLAATVIGASALLAPLVWFSAGPRGGTELSAQPTESSAGLAEVEVKDRIDLGAVANGSLVQVPIAVTSHANRPIALKEFGGSCVCQQVLELVNGQRRQLPATVVLEPNTTRTLCSEIHVSAEPGNHHAAVVHFQDDRDKLYQVVITYIPVASLYAVPRTAAFGEVPEGQLATQEVEIRSDGTFTTPLARVTTSRPDLFDVGYAPPTEEQRLPKTNDGQYLVGTLRLTLKPQPAGPVQHDAVILADGTEVLRVPVSARFVADYQLHPGQLLLPRIQSTGAPLYRARVFCRSRSGHPIQVEPVPDPDLPFDVQVGDPKEATVRVLNVQYTGPAPAGGSARRYELRFKVLDAERQAVLSLPVQVLAVD